MNRVTEIKSVLNERLVPPFSLPSFSSSCFLIGNNKKKQVLEPKSGQSLRVSKEGAKETRHEAATRFTESSDAATSTHAHLDGIVGALDAIKPKPHKTQQVPLPYRPSLEGQAPRGTARPVKGERWLPDANAMLGLG